MQHYGISGICLKWFQNNLDNRLQYTTLGNRVCSKELVPNGFPQGSVLGPILYLIYVNNIVSCNISSKVIMLVDDSVLISSHVNPEVASNNLSNDLKGLLSILQL